MKTDVDSALKDIADWYVKNRRSMTEAEFEAILKKHCENEAEVRKFAAFLQTEPGQLRFKTLLREKKETPISPSISQAEMDALRYAARDRDFIATVGLSTKVEATQLKSGQWRAYLIDFVTPWSPRGQAAETKEVVRDLYDNIITGATRNELIAKVKGEYPHWKWEVNINPSYLKESEEDAVVAETEECQLISPRHYDLLGWLGASVPDYSFAIETEAKERKIDEVLDKLKDGVSRIHESAVFREFLTTMAKFHYYSIYNQMLIALQRPAATRVAGFVTWKDLGRHVRFGEKGIAILAPCLPPRILKCPLCEKTFTERELRTHLVEVHHREDVSRLVREAREEAEAPVAATYFKVVNVFDVSQTEGKPLPEIAVPVLSGAFSRELYDKLMALASKQSLTVSFEPRPEQDPQIKGMLLGKDIWVKGDEPEAQRLKTLGHELAHYFTEAVYLIPRADAEVIAESVSFVVCAHSGFDTGTRSFPYVALWAKEKKVLEQNLASIRKISGRMIEELG